MQNNQIFASASSGGKAGQDPAVRYTEGEQFFMEQYRQLSPGHRMAVDQLIDSLLKVQTAESDVE